MILRRHVSKTNERGQALTESVIILPLMVLMVFGIWQLMLLQHARILVEYAGYNACRAGIVNNGDPNIMVHAATTSVLPLYGDTHDFEHLLAVWGQMHAMAAAANVAGDALEAMGNAVAGAVGINFNNWVESFSLIDVRILNPTDEHFLLDAWRAGERVEEIDFDDVLDPGHFSKNRLAAETRVMVPLKIPIANRVIWEAYMISMQLGNNVRFNTSIQDQIRQKTTLERNGEDIGSMITADGSIAMLRRLQLRQAQEYTQLVLLRKAGAFFVPIRSTCGMQMQSNFYQDFENRGAFDVGVFQN